MLRGSVIVCYEVPRVWRETELGGQVKIQVRETLTLGSADKMGRGVVEFEIKCPTLYNKFCSA